MKNLFAVISAHLPPWLVHALPNILWGLVIFFAGLYLARLVRKAIEAFAARKGGDSVGAGYLGRTLGTIILIIFTVAALNRMGVPVNSFLTAIGVSGIIIGLGVRAQVANYFAGIMMLMAKPFKKGDLIEFGPPPHQGRVVDVSIMYTALVGPDNVKFVVPNGVIWRHRIYNFSANDKRAVKIPVLVDYGVHKEWVRQIMLDSARRLEGVLDDPPATAVVTDLAGGGMKATLTVWFAYADTGKVKEVIPDLRNQFAAAGITATVPAADVDLKRED